MSPWQRRRFLPRSCRRLAVEPRPVQPVTDLDCRAFQRRSLDLDVSSTGQDERHDLNVQESLNSRAIDM